MSNVLVRDVDPSVLKRLKRRAEKHGRSLQSELQTILDLAASQPDPLSELEIARKIRASISNKSQTDSSLLIAEDRGR
jgi:plasmid stability protein